MSKAAIAVVIVVTLGAASGSGAVGARETGGGTYRVGLEAGTVHSSFGSVTGFPWLGVDNHGSNFDPTEAYQDYSAAIYSSLLLRTLVGTNHVAGRAGERIVPDLAVRVPVPTNGGRTYTFTLKRGVRFGPPVSRAVTSRDVRWTIERFARARNNHQDPWYFRVIKGFGAYEDDLAASISGVATPDARTVRITLTRPVGDFLYRLTLPPLAPMPREVARCFEGIHGAYGSNVVSTGPYMIEGSDRVDIRSCDSIRPASGIGTTELTLVRNPDYEPATDSRAARESNPDRFVFLALSVRELVRKVAAGELDEAVLLPVPAVTRGTAPAAARRGALGVGPHTLLVYLTMNLMQPPFDDVHVRRALNWAFDKRAAQEALGGPLVGPIAGHVVPDTLLHGRLARFAPYRTQEDRGDVARARSELARSRYANVRGVCTAAACRRVPLNVWDPERVDVRRLVPVIRSAAAKLGIRLRVIHNTQALQNAALVAETFDQDYADPAPYVETLFGRAGLGAWNDSLVGIDKAMALDLGLTGRVDRVPSIEAGLRRCSPLVGAPRLDCYAGLDRTLMTRIVPLVPIVDASLVTILGPQAAHWTTDRNASGTAYAHVVLRGYGGAR